MKIAIGLLLVYILMVTLGVISNRYITKDESIWENIKFYSKGFFICYVFIGILFLIVKYFFI